MRHAILPLVVALLIAGCGQPTSKVTPAATPASNDKVNTVAAAANKPAAAAPVAPADAKPDATASAPEKPAVPDKANKTDKPDKTDKVVRSEEEWKEMLSPEQYYVLREKGTERPYTNKYDEHFEPGVYACAGCGQELFTSKTKFNSGCGWPAFYAASAGNRVKLIPDNTLGMRRTEVVCARCDGHLGHIFDDAPRTPTGQRYCINSVSLKFIPAPIRPDEPKKTEEPNK